MTGDLVRLAEARQELSPLSEAKRLRARASAVELHRTRVGAQEAGNDAGEIKVRAERALAILDVAAQPGKTRHDHLTGVSDVPLAGMREGTRALIRKLASLAGDVDVTDAEWQTSRRWLELPVAGEEA